MKKSKGIEIVIPKSVATIVAGVTVLVLLFAVYVKYSGFEAFSSRIDYLKKYIPTGQTAVGFPFEDVGTWNTYRNDTYGFEFKHPSYLTPSEHAMEYSTKTAVDINYGWDMLRILTDQEGVGFEQREMMTYELLRVDGKDVQIYGKPIRKTKVVQSAIGRTNSFYFLFINYPHVSSKTMMVNYVFSDGVINDQSNKLFDKIISTLTFFDPGQASVLNPTGYTTFQSKLLNLSFRYPSAWGQTKESLKTGDTGQAYILTFGGKAGAAALGLGNILAEGRTKDYSVGRGGYIADAAHGFSSAQEICNSYYGKQGSTCSAINQNLVTQLVVPRYEDVCPPNPGQYWFSLRVWVNLSGQAVDGFLLEYTNFWSKQFTDLTSPDLDCAKTDKQKFEVLVTRIAEKLKSGDVDQETKANLAGFDAFVKSIAIR